MFSLCVVPVKRHWHNIGFTVTPANLPTYHNCTGRLAFGYLGDYSLIILYYEI